MFIRLILIIIIFIAITFIWGRSFLLRIKGDLSFSNCMLIGFLVYFSLFQLIAFPMTVIQRSLTELTYSWVLLAVAICILCLMDKSFWAADLFFIKKSVFSWEFFAAFLAGIALICFMVNSNVNGWDQTYYIGGVNTFVATDSMYIYDGTGGWKQDSLNMRYVISSFWINDAVFAKLFSVHGTLVCKYYNTFLSGFFSVLVVYALGKQIFKEKKHGYRAVVIWILANFTMVSGGDDDLLLRGMENKPLCAHFVLPIVLLIIIRIWGDTQKTEHWKCLFLANFASVAISGTALALVPIINACCLGANWLYERNGKNFWRMVVCMTPCLLYMVIYILAVSGLWQMKVVT